MKLKPFYKVRKVEMTRWDKSPWVYEVYSTSGPLVRCKSKKTAALISEILNKARRRDMDVKRKENKVLAAVAKIHDRIDLLETPLEHNLNITQDNVRRLGNLEKDYHTLNERTLRLKGELPPEPVRARKT